MSMIRVENLTFAYPSSYDNIFENVNFQIDTDWKLGFVGRNGRGKTTFLNLLLGKYEYHGKIQSSVQFDYFPYVMTQYTDWKGERKPKCKRGFATKREAQDWEQKFQQQSSGDLDMPFSAFVEIYCREQQPRLKESTWQTKENIKLDDLGKGDF